MNRQDKRAIVLLSGGIDSSTCLAVATNEGYSCHALTIRYGQRNQVEIDSACRVARAMKVFEHRIAEQDLRWLGGSVLTGPGQVPKSIDGVAPFPAVGVPTTYVPARNSIFLCLAAAWAEIVEASHLFIGVNQIDFSGYPDCRPVFIDAMQNALRLGTNNNELLIHAPLQHLSKGQIIRWGTQLGLDYGLTWSCYDPQEGLPCGLCDSCIHRKKGFREAGIHDPTRA